MMKKNNLQAAFATIGDLLEQISRCNERIKLLASYKAPELEQSILNAKSLRKQFLAQLDEVMAGYGVEVKERVMVA
jgi:hypothetical protein